MTEPSTTRSRTLRRLAGTASVTTALAVLAAPALVSTSSTAAELTFPYEHRFTSPAGGALHGDATVAGGRLRLTEDVRKQAGAWSTDDTFPSDTGLEIEFTYTMHTAKDDPGADGLLLFLADGAAPQGVGSFGAGLGYTCRKESTEGGSPQCDLPGVPGGFAAVALDHYGNFSARINGSGPGASPQHVVIRGSGDGVEGYRYIAGAPAPTGVLAPGDDPRRVRITLLPGDAGELTMSVRLQEGDEMRPVLSDVPLHGDGQAPLPPTLRLGFSAATGSHVNVHEIEQFSVRKPADLAVEQDLPPTLAAGETVEYTATARNVGVNDSAPSPFTVDVPDALRDVTWRCAAADDSACGDPSGSGDVRTDLDLPRGGSATVTIAGTVDGAAVGEAESTATIAAAPSVSDVDESDNRSRATTVVEAAAVAHVETDKRVEPSTDVAPGDEVEYTVTARNRGPADAADVGAVDDLPAAMRFVGSPDDCTAEGQRVTCRSGESLAAGRSVDFRVRAVLDPDYTGDGSDVVNVATATSPTDPDGGDESEEVTIAVVDPADPGPTATPRPSRSSGPAVTPGVDRGRPDGRRPDGATGGASDGRPAAGAGMLAYTGAADLGVTGALAAVVLSAGAACWCLARRRRRAVDVVAETTASEADEG